MIKANADIRSEAKQAGVPVWKIAMMLGVSEPTMTRKLRVELSADEKCHIREVIRLAISECDTGEARA